MEASPLHIRHCIDLLRQTLMCRLDVTVELKNEELDGVTGFGTAHQCKDWTQLMQWMSKWENYQPEEVPSREEHIHVTGDHVAHGGHETR